MNKDIGVYIHIPFCKSKCYYCDFSSWTKKDEYVSNYVKCLKEEILCENEYTVNTIYIGGGTPSYIDSKYIVEIVETLKNKFSIAKNAEITIEVNPGTVTKTKLADYKKAGINRVSIGMQSTHNSFLKEIGRIHTYEEFVRTYNLAREIGFQNINVDIIIAIMRRNFG